MFTAIWNYRSFVLGSIKSDFLRKYCKSLLGTFWVAANPLYMILIYTVIFSHMARPELGKLPYPVYVASGTLTWAFFLDTLNRCLNVYIDYGNIIKKLNFPHLCLQLIAVANATIGFLITLIFFMIYLFFTQHFPGWSLFMLLPILLIQTMLAVGIGTFLGILNIFFRDISQATTVILQLVFWLTPIVYLSENLPLTFLNIIQLNPLTSLIDAYHAIFVYQVWPDWQSLAYPASCAVFFCMLSMYFYRQHLVEILDEL